MADNRVRNASDILSADKQAQRATQALSQLAVKKGDRVEVYYSYLKKSPPTKLLTGTNFKSWKRRYFVLRTNPVTLEYYGNETSYLEGDAPKGVVPLDECTGCIEMDDAKIVNLFSLVTPSRTFFLSSPSKEEKAQWAAILRPLMSKTKVEIAYTLDQMIQPPKQTEEMSLVDRSVKRSIRRKPSLQEIQKSVSGVDCHLAVAHLSKHWYYGKISRGEATAILQSQFKDTNVMGFLVRESSTAGNYALSLCNQGQVSHVQILQHNGMYYFNDELGPGQFPTLTQLIESEDFRNQLYHAQSEPNVLVPVPANLGGPPKPPRAAAAGQRPGEAAHHPDGPYEEIPPIDVGSYEDVNPESYRPPAKDTQQQQQNAANRRSGYENVQLPSIDEEEPVSPHILAMYAKVQKEQPPELPAKAGATASADPSGYEEVVLEKQFLDKR